MRQQAGWRNAAVALLVLILAASAVAAGARGANLLARAQTEPLTLSPARGHAEVVAQGVDALPAGETVWRVAYHTAKPFPESPVGGRDLGFLVADQGALMVAEPATGRQTLLAPGEAVFVPGGAEQRRGALDAQPATYYALELAPAAAADQVGTGLAVYASPPFAAPSGERDLNLVRDVLAPDEATSIAGAAAPVLVLATLGMIRVESSDGAAASLRVGEAASFEGDLTIRGEGLTDAAFVAAVIGRDVAAPPAASPAATPSATGSGIITAVVHACPADTLPGRDNLTQCPAEPKAISLSLAALDGPGPRDVGAPIFNDGVPTWSALPLGDYLLRATAFAPGNDRFFAPGLSGLGGPPEAGYPASPEMGYRIRLTEGTTSVRLDVYAFAAGADAAQPAATGTPGATSPTATAGPDTGSIAIRVFVCSGTSFETFDPAACSPVAAGFEVTFAGEALPTPIGLAEAESAPDGTLVWDDLPLGQYVFAQPLMPPGAVSYYIPHPSVTLLDDLTGYVVTLDAANPDIVLDVYDLVLPPTAIPEPTTAPIDSDGDGLTDDAEINVYGTRVDLFDTDGDGVGDGDEIAAGTDPFTPPAAAPTPTPAPPPPAVDTDLDGLTDPDEAAFGTSATDPDSDDDGWLDGNEVSLGTNPLDPTSFPVSP